MNTKSVDASYLIPLIKARKSSQNISCLQTLTLGMVVRQLLIV
jgi:hypothetical protein